MLATRMSKTPRLLLITPWLSPPGSYVSSVYWLYAVDVLYAADPAACQAIAAVAAVSDEDDDDNDEDDEDADDEAAVAAALVVPAEDRLSKTSAM